MTEFEIVHEKLFHLFIVSEDLNHFLHEHPEFRADHTFRYQAKFPKPGMYRLLSDFYPKGGTPQLIERTVLVSGSGSEPPQQPQLTADLSEKKGSNIDVELVTEPAFPIAGMKTLMFFRIKPADGLEQYLGAWGHMLAASDDLVDTIHNHPFLADGGPQVQFNQIFPRARTYRVWVQFQRKGCSKYSGVYDPRFRAEVSSRDIETPSGGLARIIEPAGSFTAVLK